MDRMSEISDTVDRVRRAFDSGKTRPRRWREEQLIALHTLLHEEQEEILAALASDIGKGTFEGYTSEIALVSADIENTRRHLAKWMRSEKVGLPVVAGVGASAKIVHDPLGVALIIGAWNYPIMLTLQPLIGAIAGGNGAVIKPSELVPRCAEVLEAAIGKYLDPEAFAVVQGGIPETTEVLAQRFDKIFFTGSPLVGKIVMRAAAEHLTPVVLELGGKSPAVICKDANLEVAATRIAWGKFFNAGQTCIGVDYAMVHESVYDEFLALVTKRIQEFYGEDPRASADLARIVNLPNLQRIAGLIEGQSIVTGGQVVEEDLYIAPTVLRDVSVQSPIMNDEIFGPVLPTMAFSKLSEVIDHVNAGEKPLAAYFFTGSRATANRLLEGITSGGACVNDCLTHITVGDAPFGGVGASGMGAYHGLDGYLTFTHRRTVLTRATAFDPSVRYPPYTPAKTKIATYLV